MPYLSIIVPIYNVQNYLPACLDSILRQDLNSVEVILINDGSTDASGKIARSYTKKYRHFKLIEQKNQGLSVARNVGLENAKGDYVLFVDSDDYLANSGLSKLLKQAKENQLDLIVGNYIQISESGELDRNQIIERDLPISGLVWFKECLKERSHRSAVWFRIYRRLFLLKNMLLFVPKLLKEDQLFSFQLFCADPKMICIDIPFYCYRLRPGSITTNQDYASCLARLNSDIYTFEKSLVLSQTLDDSELSYYIMEHCTKFLELSWLMLCFSVNGRFRELDEVIKKLAQLQLWRYIKVRRFSSLKMKICAWISTKLYLNYLYKRKLRKIKIG